MKHKNPLVVLILLLCIAAMALWLRNRETQIDLVLKVPSSGTVASTSWKPQAISSQSSAPRSLRITVPFSPQAPAANWDALHEEACEEMALLMVLHYWKQTPLSPADAENELQELIAWEHANGYKDDVTAQELMNIAVMHDGAEVILDTDVSAENIKKYLRQGKPVIVPTAGRMLRNPYYSGDGPWYHALVITGYEGGRFITNDPGTKRGENYPYAQSVILNAIHDWTGKKEDIAQGRKAMLIVDGITP